MQKEIRGTPARRECRVNKGLEAVAAHGSEVLKGVLFFLMGGKRILNLM
jgi:hypothetical protein